ncbi:MAG: hypothetical protein JWN76_35 [Chitinophagaceae bacterium]|nr:hypothetical protein [Chitinophagaceae bacterium]
MNEKNIVMLKARLEMLGFTHAIEERLLGFLWYQQWNSILSLNSLPVTTGAAL